MSPRAKSKQAVAGPLRVAGYCRVSTGEQAESGAGLVAQRQAIEAAAEQRGWQLVEMFTDAGVTGSKIDRPGLNAALAMIERGDADGLCVAKLDRLSRSLVDFATLMARSRKQAWSVIALDLGLDTSTPSGEMMASVLATFAQFERRLIGERTKSALAVKRQQGVTLGRPRQLGPAVVERILAERVEGLSFAKIADGLNRDGIPTAQGGAKWWPETVRGIAGYASGD